MGLDDVAAVDLVVADAAVVAALRCREAAEGEAVRTAVLEERVLLPAAEERLHVRVLLGGPAAGPARVRGARRHGAVERSEERRDGEVWCRRVRYWRSADNKTRK